MHKPLLFAFVLLSLAGAALAQPTLTAADYNYTPGDGYVQYAVGTGSAPDPGAGGNNVTWDFSNAMTSAIADTFAAMTCSSTPYCSSFPGSTVAATFSSQPSGSYSYYIADANRFAIRGIRQNIPQLSQAITMDYVEPEDWLRFPFTTTTTYSDSFATTYTSNGYPYLRRGHIDVSCDGYGTLKLPGGKVYTNVIRIVRKETYNDSTNFGTGGPQYNYYNSVIYEWRQPGTRALLMSRDSLKMALFTGSTTYSATARYSTPLPAAINDANIATTSLIVYPNPVQNVVHVKFNIGSNTPVRIALINMVGQEVAIIVNETFSGAQQVSYNTSLLPKGLYLLRMETANGITTQKVEVL